MVWSVGGLKCSITSRPTPTTHTRTCAHFNRITLCYILLIVGLHYVTLCKITNEKFLEHYDRWSAIGSMALVARPQRRPQVPMAPMGPPAPKTATSQSMFINIQQSKLSRSRPQRHEHYDSPPHPIHRSVSSPGCQSRVVTGVAWSTGRDW